MRRILQKVITDPEIIIKYNIQEAFIIVFSNSFSYFLFSSEICFLFCAIVNIIRLLSSTYSNICLKYVGLKCLVPPIAKA